MCMVIIYGVLSFVLRNRNLMSFYMFFYTVLMTYWRVAMVAQWHGM